MALVSRSIILAWAAAALAAGVMGPAGVGRAERIKDIVEIQGVRSNPLMGRGLVVGLNGTGDGSDAAKRMLANALRRTGLALDAEAVSSKNIAVVMVTADLPPFSHKGDTIDVTVSALGNSSSLLGGTLLLTELMGADSQVYAVAQGNLVLGGYSASGQSSSITKNHTTVGRIANGAVVEREEIATFIQNNQISLQLRNHDFTTAQNIAEAIDAVYPGSATAVDAGIVRVDIPKKLARGEVVGFINSILEVQAKVDTPARVVINERTGTIVVGENVTISTVAITHGSLSIITKEKDKVSQPLPFSSTGTTAVTHETDIKAVETKGPMQVIQRQVTVSDLARALNAMGLTPRELISIFEALRKEGALQARLEVM